MSTTPPQKYNLYDPKDIIRYWIITNWRPSNFYGQYPTTNTVANQRNIEAKSVKDNYVRVYNIFRSPIISRDANYDYQDADVLIGVDIQCANDKMKTRCVFETRRAILQARKNPDPRGSTVQPWQHEWDLMFVQDETDRTIEEKNIFHYVMDIKLVKISKSIVEYVNTDLKGK